ncbi:hypothetical protein ACTOXX_33965 [Streptomyces rubiginosohelvolus]
MSTDPNPREVEAAGPDDTAHPGEPPDPAPERPHEPGARPAPLSRLLYP